MITGQKDHNRYI